MASIIRSTVLALLLSLSSAVECGDIIHTDTVLDQDLVCECDDSNPLGPGLGVGLLVVGPATLDLAGHSVSCSHPGTIQAPNICISPADSGAIIINGDVSNCYIGVGGFGWFSDSIIKCVRASGTGVGFYLAGSNNNKVIGVVDDGGAIVVQGDNNLIKHNRVMNSPFESIYVTGDTNRVIGNIIENNLYSDSDKVGSAALLVQPCDSCPCETCANEWPGPEYYPKDNTIEDNIIRDSAGIAMRIFSNDTYIRGNKVYNVAGSAGLIVGFSGSYVVDNMFQNMSTYGIRVSRGSMRIVSNSVRTAGIDGIDVTSQAFDCIVKDNRIEKCDGNGIRIRSSHHKVVENRIAKCGTGIRVLADANNTNIMYNRVWGCSNVELYDESENCDTDNHWVCNQGDGNYACTEVGEWLCDSDDFDLYTDNNDWRSK